MSARLARRGAEHAVPALSLQSAYAEPRASGFKREELPLIAPLSHLFSAYIRTSRHFYLSGWPLRFVEITAAVLLTPGLG